MFSHIGRFDRRLMLMNGLLLLFVVLTPFTTLIVSGHLSIATDAGTAAAFYSGNFLLIAVAWNVLWRYCAKDRRLLAEDVTDDEAKTTTRQNTVPPSGQVMVIPLPFFPGRA